MFQQVSKYDDLNAEVIKHRVKCAEFHNSKIVNAKSTIDFDAINQQIK